MAGLGSGDGDTSVPEIRVGTEIAGLRIEELAGRGGSSVVFRATDLRTGAPRAVKVLLRSDPSARRRLEREAALLATVDHPAVVPFRRLHVDADRALLITDWVDGRSLQDLLRSQGPLPPDRALAVVAALAVPLDHLHALGIVHRDITPANVLVRPDGSLMLIDLGIGHRTDASTLTSDDLLAGTPSYLAPEVIRGEPASGASDQYSLAVLAHQLITGSSPFPNGGEVATALHHQLHTAPTPLDEIDQSVPTGLAEAVVRAMAKEPDRRFASVAEFARAAASPSGPDAERPRSRLRSAMVGAATVAVVAAVALWAGFGRDRTEDDQAVEPAPDGDATAAAADPEGGGRPVIEVEPGDPTVGAGWEQGTAATIECNLLTGHDFQTGSIPVDYFGDPPGRERVVESGGFDDSWALEVGEPGRFGQYGEIVDIEPGRGYLFRGWFELIGTVAEAELGISFLDEGFQGVGEGVRTPLTTGSAGFREVRIATPPTGATRAVPYLYKDGSVGVLLADELVFGPIESCEAEVARRMSSTEPGS